jgi:hypothetical protein
MGVLRTGKNECSARISFSFCCHARHFFTGTDQKIAIGPTKTQARCKAAATKLKIPANFR